jgi:hypothetical protein
MVVKIGKFINLGALLVIMRKATVALLGALALGTLGACAKDEPAPAPRAQSAPLVEATPQPPRTDDTFSNPQKYNAWKAGVQGNLDTIAGTAYPSLYFDLSNMYSVNAASLVGDAAQWRVPNDFNPYSPPETRPRAELAVSAKAHEAGNESYEAAKEYRALNDVAGMRRCMGALEGKLEWAAVSMVAVDLNDAKTLEKSIGILLDSDMTTAPSQTFWHAVDVNSPLAAQIRAKYTDVTGSDILSNVGSGEMDAARRASLRGATSYLDTLIQNQFGSWEQDEGGSVDYDGLVMNIAVLGRNNAQAAREFAKRYVANPDANTFMVVSSGEGTSITPMAGIFDVYRMIAKDAAVRQQFFDRTAALVKGVLADDAYALSPNVDISGEFGLQGAPSAFASYLGMVRETKDAALSAFWLQQLDEMGAARPYTAQVGKLVLQGTAPNPDAAGLLPTESAALRRLSGPYSPKDVPKELAYDLAHGALLMGMNGTLTEAKFRQAWDLLELPKSVVTHTYKASELAEAVSTAQKLAPTDYDLAGQMMVNASASGYRGPWPENMSAPNEALYFMFASNPEAAQRHVRGTIIERFSNDYNARLTAENSLVSNLEAPFNAAWTNNQAVAAGASAPTPKSEVDAVAIVEPLLQQITSAAPRAFERLALERHQANENVLYQRLLSGLQTNLPELNRVLASGPEYGPSFSFYFTEGLR